MFPEYVAFEEKYCTGCTMCVRACPVKAIRVRNHKAVYLPDLCIGCGECIRVCPEGAVSATMGDIRLPKTGQITVAVVSPTLYAQFSGVMPFDVLLGLKRIGFQYAIDLSIYLEMFQYAVEEYIVRRRGTKDAVWPLISPICPVINRLIALKFPDLVANILPIKRPVALLGEEIRKHLSESHGVPENGVVLYHITPCPSKVVTDGIGIGGGLGYMDRAVGINRIYPELFQKITEIRDLDLSLFPYEDYGMVPNARGPQWGMSGGEIAGMRLEKTLAVSGLRESMMYIRKIEMGLFEDMEYIELRACPEGCLGGPLTAADRYIAKSRAQQLISILGINRRLPREKIHRLYESGWFHSRTRPTELTRFAGDRRTPLTLESIQQIEKFLSRIHGNDCAACGAPDCRTFAEDVVRGYADINDCHKVRCP